jgi:predicted nucleotidyltransferase
MAFEKLKSKWLDDEKVAIQNAAFRKTALLEKGQAVFKRYGVRRAILFGSVAKGKSSMLSDIDIYAAPLPQDQYWQFRSELEESLGYPVDVYTEYDTANVIKRAIQAGEVIYES